MRQLRAVFVIALVIGCKPNHGYKNQSELDTVTPLGNCGNVDLTTYLESGSSIGVAELAAIKKYTSDDNAPEGKKFYRVINDGLRNLESSTLTRYCSFIKTLSSAVNKLRAKNGSCSAARYLDLPYSVVQKMSKRGQFYSDRGFVSSTLNMAPPKGFGTKTDVIYIETDKCPEVTSYSSIPTEREALFPPGTDFIVTRDSQVTNTNGVYYNKFWLKVYSGQPVANLNPNNAGNIGQYANHKPAANTPPANAGVDKTKDFVDKVFSGTDNQGKVRMINFLASGQAKYTGASGKTQNASWVYRGPDSIVLRLASNDIYYYKVSSDEKICFLNGQGGSIVSCLVIDDGGVVVPANPPAAADADNNAAVAQATLSHKDFIGNRFVGTDAQGVARSITFQANQVATSVGASGTAKNGKWTFVAPNKIKVEFQGGNPYWYEAQSASRICFMENNVATSSCMDK